MQSNTPEGFEVPVHRSVVEPIFIAGLPRKFCFLLWTIAAALGLGMQALWVIPLAVGLHLVFAKLAKNEPYFMDIFIRAMKFPHRLDP